MFERFKRTIKCQLRRFEYHLSKRVNNIWFEKVRFRQETKKRLNYKNPVSFNEKLFWLNRYWQDPVKVQCSDKFLMREFVREKGLSNLLNKFYGVWENADDIVFENLPDSFVLKCTHGCGFNIVVKNKDQIDQKKVKKQLSDWLLIDYGKLYNEFHYSKIKPRIICEKYLKEIDSDLIVDYKVHCLNGMPAFFLICRERENGKAKLSSYSLDWHRLPYLKNEDSITIPRPECLNEIIQNSKLLSAEFPYVRLDYYIIDGVPFLGEFTFTPYANTVSYYKDEVLLEIGKLLFLPELLHPR